MYSKHADTILDPFFGTGTTSIAAMILTRNSIGIDMDESFISSFNQRLAGIVELSKKYYTDRIQGHNNFLNKRVASLKYMAEKIKMPVMTSQEINIRFYNISKVSLIRKDVFLAEHEVFIL